MERLSNIRWENGVVLGTDENGVDVVLVRSPRQNEVASTRRDLALPPRMDYWGGQYIKMFEIAIERYQATKIPFFLRIAEIASQWYVRMKYHVHRPVTRNNDRERKISCLDDARRQFGNYFATNFRFTYTEFQIAHRMLEIPEVSNPAHGARMPGEVAFLILLNRFAKGGDWSQIGRDFGFSSSSCTAAAKDIENHIFDRFDHLISPSKGCMDRFVPFAQNWNEKILEKFAELMGKDTGVEVGLDQQPGETRYSFCLVDGCNLCVARAGNGIRADFGQGPNLQEGLYSGYKGHSILTVAVVAPNGLVIATTGPCTGNTNDNRALTEEGIFDTVRERFAPVLPNCKLFGDSLYGNTDVMVAMPNHNQAAFRNPIELKNLAKVRSAVEWSFRDWKQKWEILGKISAMTTGARPVGVMLHVAILLHNVYVCIHGSRSETFFDCQGMTIEEYLAPLPPNGEQ